MIKILELNISVNGGFICWLKARYRDTCIGGVRKTGGFGGRESGTFIDSESIVVIFGGFVDNGIICLVNDVPEL